MDIEIPLGISGKKSMVVDVSVTAQHIGSGTVNVLATPMMIALMEAAALEMVQGYMPRGWTTVGTKVDVEHLKPSLLGETVTAEAVLQEKQGRLLVFSVTARDGHGVIGQGKHHRVIIELERWPAGRTE